MNEDMELNRRVAEELFGLETEIYGQTLVECVDIKKPKGFYPLDYLIPRYSTDIGSAWLIIEKVRSMLFSRRQFFYKALQVEVNKELISEVKFHPTWQLQFLEPRHICLAALKLVEWQKGMPNDE